MENIPPAIQTRKHSMKEKLSRCSQQAADPLGGAGRDEAAAADPGHSQQFRTAPSAELVELRSAGERDAYTWTGRPTVCFLHFLHLSCLMPTLSPSHSFRLCFADTCGGTDPEASTSQTPARTSVPGSMEQQDRDRDMDRSRDRDSKRSRLPRPHVHKEGMKGEGKERKPREEGKEHKEHDEGRVGIPVREGLRVRPHRVHREEVKDSSVGSHGEGGVEERETSEFSAGLGRKSSMMDPDVTARHREERRHVRKDRERKDREGRQDGPLATTTTIPSAPVLQVPVVDLAAPAAMLGDYVETTSGGFTATLPHGHGHAPAPAPGHVEVVSREQRPGDLVRRGEGRGGGWSNEEGVGTDGGRPRPEEAVGVVAVNTGVSPSPVTPPAPPTPPRSCLLN